MSYRKNLDGRYLIHLILKIHVAFKSFFLEFTLGNFMKKNALTAFDQIKGLVLDELKESLGLPQYLNNPQCSLSNQKYNPNINGIKNSINSLFDIFAN